ncbi:MAG: nucleotidyl transferase AbiEii/AbiGii toxin family protein [Candidatus Parcubacteria bacterium]|nr:nucleotidyl transferase AbiEii/AbiGii toxin family protein [Candidatus Parcubacteria bacterium]
MMIELLDRPTLLLRNKKLRYPLAIAEKDYFLALVSKIIYNSPLREKLIFKGGTAIHHVYLPQLRFSEDLDFSTNHSPITLEEIKSVLEQQDFLTVRKDYVSESTIKIERLSFDGPLGQVNSLKVEVDFLQNVILPSKDLDYQNEYGIKTKVRVMDIREIAAEKIRAMNDRIRYRDFYDFTMIFSKFKLDAKEVVGLVRQKEIRKNISPANILSNWKLAKENKANELSAIRFTEELNDKQVEKYLLKLDFDILLPTVFKN